MFVYFLVELISEFSYYSQHPNALELLTYSHIENTLKLVPPNPLQILNLILGLIYSTSCCLGYDWFLSRKKMNKQAHSVNGNSMPPGSTKLSTFQQKQADEVRDLKESLQTAQAELRKLQTRWKDYDIQAAKSQVQATKPKAGAPSSSSAAKPKAGAPSSSSAAKQPRAQRRLVGLQPHRKDLIDAAVNNNDRLAYVDELHSNGLWTVLQVFKENGDSLIPALALQSASEASQWSERESDHCRNFIACSSDAKLLPFNTIADTYRSFVSTSPAQVKRTASSINLPLPQPKHVRFADPVQQVANKTSVPATLSDPLTSIKADIDEIKAYFQKQPPQTQLSARKAMYTTKVEGAEKTDKRVLAREKVREWIAGNAVLFPKCSDIFKLLNTEENFDAGKREHVTHVLLQLMNECSGVESIDPGRVAQVRKEISDCLSNLTDLAGSGNASKETVKLFVKELNKSGNLQEAGIILRTGTLTSLALKSQLRSSSSTSSSSSKYSSSSSSSQKRKNNNNICFWCRESGHMRNDCPYLSGKKTMPASYYCTAYNSSSGCTLASACPKVHRCPKCRVPHSASVCPQT